MTGCNSIMSLHPHDLGNGQCRWDNCPLYDLLTESSLGVQNVLKSLPLIQHLFGHTKSDVETSGAETYNFRMVLLSPYVLWGTRTGSCRVFVYILLREIPLEYWALLYIVEKTFSKGSQRRWNREKRFSIHGEIKGTR